MVWLWFGCVVWLYGVAVRCGCTVWLCGVAARSEGGQNVYETCALHVQHILGNAGVTTVEASTSSVCAVGVECKVEEPKPALLAIW